MTETADSSTWTREQVNDAMIAVAIDGAATFAQQAYLACTHAAVHAPAGQQEAWAQAIVRSWAEDLVAVSMRMSDDLDATDDQRLALIQGRAAAFDRRFAELVLMAGPHHGSA